MWGVMFGGFIYLFVCLCYVLLVVVGLSFLNEFVGELWWG